MKLTRASTLPVLVSGMRTDPEVVDFRAVAACFLSKSYRYVATPVALGIELREDAVALEALVCVSAVAIHPRLQLLQRRNHLLLEIVVAGQVEHDKPRALVVGLGSQGVPNWRGSAFIGVRSLQIRQVAGGRPVHRGPANTRRRRSRAPRRVSSMNGNRCRFISTVFGSRKVLSLVPATPTRNG